MEAILSPSLMKFLFAMGNSIGSCYSSLLKDQKVKTLVFSSPTGHMLWSFSYFLYRFEVYSLQSPQTIGNIFKFWTSTNFFSNSTVLSVTSGQFFPFIALAWAFGTDVDFSSSPTLGRFWIHVFCFKLVLQLRWSGKTYTMSDIETGNWFLLMFVALLWTLLTSRLFLVIGLVIDYFS